MRAGIRTGLAGLSRPARLGIWAAILTLVLDQATKLPLIRILDAFGPAPGQIRLGPFFDLIVVWNRGISYGLFQQHSGLGRWLLVGVSIVAAIALTIWMLRAPGRLLALSLGLIVGGAIGNVIDRLAYAAVFDFAHLHWGAWSWYVFNLADAAIVAGVAGLLYDSLIAEGRRVPRS